MSDDGRYGLTVIGFVGSVFSPYYALARRRGQADPKNFCAVNVALYGAAGKRWAMTERGRGQLQRDPRWLQIGPSSMRWHDGVLEVALDEITVPFPARLRGRLRLEPDAVTRTVVALDAAHRHCWWPIAPCARIRVELDQPALRWQGDAYLDSNAGDEPLEAGFSSWHWCRVGGAAGTTVIYDLTPRTGSPGTLALAFDRRLDEPRALAPPGESANRRTRIWRIPRRIPADAADQPRVLQTLEDTPFYARSLVRTRLDGRAVRGIHETLSLDRFRRRAVQLMLPFRMPRSTR